MQLRLTIVLNKYILQIMFESQKRIGTGKKNIYIYILFKFKEKKKKKTTKLLPLGPN